MSYNNVKSANGHDDCNVSSGIIDSLCNITHSISSLEEAADLLEEALSIFLVSSIPVPSEDSCKELVNSKSPLRHDLDKASQNISIQTARILRLITRLDR